MTASCGIWLARFPVTEKTAAPIKVKPSAMTNAVQLSRSMSKKHRETNSERRHLRHGDVDENDAALHDVQAEINQQPRQKNAGHDRPKHYFPHNYFSAAASRETSVSINFT